MSTPVVATRTWSLKPLGALSLWIIIGLAGIMSALIYLQAASIGFDPLVSGFVLLALSIAAAVAVGWRWAPLLGALWSILLLAAFGPFMIYDLTHPAVFDHFTTKLQARVGETITLRLENKDANTHSFDIDELDVHALMPSGKSALALFTPSKPGSYTFYCGVPGHREAGMVGTLVSSRKALVLG